MNDVLIHHGIRGQKWGVRRFENADGTLTNAGKKRYHEDSDGNYVKLSRKEQKINAYTQKYRAKGMDAQTARAEAERTVRRNRDIKIAAAVAGVAAGAYLAKKYYDRNVDKTYSNVNYKHIAMDKDVHFKKALYVSDNERDNKRYSLYAKQMHNTFGNNLKPIYEHNIVGYDIKVAGHKTGQKALQEIFDKMSLEEKNNLRQYTVDRYGKTLTNGNKITKSGYEAFNRALVDHGTKGHDEVINKYYDLLKRKGFDGIQDINDEKYSGYNTKAKIIFNRAKIIETQVKEKSYEKDYMMNAHSELGKALAEQKLKDNIVANAPVAAASTVGGVAYGVFLDSLRKDQLANTQGKKAIDNYKKEHPNTKMSNAEILDMLSKD